MGKKMIVDIDEETFHKFKVLVAKKRTSIKSVVSKFIEEYVVKNEKNGIN